jgi:hypothetical protein
MKIYKNEIKDGVADLVQANASIAYCSQALLCADEFVDDSDFIAKLKAESANPNQIDLYYIKSILVSTGWNKNDDVFDNQSTWAARDTPEDKQFNFMHNENDIIGHITGSYVVDKEGNKIEAEEAPQEFDIVTEAVLYNSWTDPENRDRMQQIIAEMEEGKWFVSMECLFAGFDYALLDEGGNGKVLARNEDSSFLTKHLRAYGGSGEYENYKIGRSLREISFSGKGLVSKPANPRSIILDASKAFLNSNVDVIKLSKGENTMTDNNVLEQQIADLKTELASARDEAVELRAKVDESASKEYLDTIAKLEETLASNEEVVKALEVSVAEKEAAYTELHESVEAKNKDFQEKMEELKKMKKEKKAEARKAELLDLGFDADEAEESVASYEDFDDATFDTIIAGMKKKAQVDEKKKATVKNKKEDEEEAGVKPAKSEEVVVEAEAEEAEAEVAAEEALENVETTEAALVEATEEADELTATRASVAEWLENNVLSK